MQAPVLGVGSTNVGALLQGPSFVKTNTKNCNGILLRGLVDRGFVKSSIIKATAYHPV